MISSPATDVRLPIRKCPHIATDIALISNNPGRITSAPNVPHIIVTQINPRNTLNGIQLRITAVMEIIISVRYMIVCFSPDAIGRKSVVTPIITAATIPNGAAFQIAVERNLPLIRLVSDSRIVRKDG